MRRLALVLVAMVAAVPAASASPFTWTVAGTIRSVTTPGNVFVDSYIQSSGYAGAFVVGQPFMWMITMESSVPDAYPQFANCGAYQPIVSMTLVTGSLNLSAMPGGSQDYFVNAAGPGFCEVPTITTPGCAVSSTARAHLG